ncbi:MAG: hypothetical protein VCC04_13590 [Myxococcota bacterium]
MSRPAGSSPLGLADLQEFAESRGGSCLETEFRGNGALHRWRCARGHAFEARPKILMAGGYWCEACQPSLDGPAPWDWDAIAQGDPAIARFQWAGRTASDDPAE